MRVARWLTPLAVLAIPAALIVACATGGPDASPTAPTFCGAASAWAAKCGTPTVMCDGEILNACAALENVLNPVALESARKCLLNATDCSATPTACLSGASQGLTPTAAQTKVETDYCETCQPQGEGDCKQAFFTANSPVEDTSTALLELDDTVATDVDKCASGSGCGSTFEACAQMSLLTSLSNALDGDNATVSCVIKAITQPSTATDAGSGDDDTTDSGFLVPDSSIADASSDASHDGSTGTDGGNLGDGGACTDNYEPNNTPDMATQFAVVKDSDDPQDIHAAISVAGTDEDWFTFMGDDAFNTTTSADPWASATALTNVEVCIWAKETGGSAIASGCMSGNPTDYPIAGTPYIGCCSSTGTAQIQNYGRTGSDDSSQVMMRVRIPNSGPMCVGYDLQYSFTK